MIDVAQRILAVTTSNWSPGMERREGMDLFGEVPKAPRAPRQWRMHVIDAGDNCGDENYEVVARFKCYRCGTETDWLQVENVTIAKRGLPCEKCNGEKNGQ